MNLALKYRPTQFSEVVGQKAVTAVLQAMITKGVLDQVLLFTGPSGVGKTSVARIIAAQLNSEGSSGHILEIDAASNGSVAAMRSLKQDLAYATAGHTVVILDEAHAMSDEGKAVLLNMLEFPFANVTFILITTEAHEIPIEVRHRCDTYNFKKASVPDLMARLTEIAEKESISVDEDLLNLISQRSEGSFREALMLLKQVWAGDITTIQQYYDLHGEMDYGPVLLKSAMKGPMEGMKSLKSALLMTTPDDICNKIIETLSHLILLKGNFSLYFTAEALETRTLLANRLTPQKILKCQRIFWDLQTKLSQSDRQLGLEMAFSLVCETIGEMPDEVVSAPVKDRPMTFAEMQARRS